MCTVVAESWKEQAVLVCNVLGTLSVLFFQTDLSSYGRRLIGLCVLLLRLLSYIESFLFLNLFLSSWGFNW